MNNEQAMLIYLARLIAALPPSSVAARQLRDELPRIEALTVKPAPRVPRVSRFLVHVSGGVIQGIESPDTPNADFLVIDYDVSDFPTAGDEQWTVTHENGRTETVEITEHSPLAISEDDYIRYAAAPVAVVGKEG